MSAELASGGTSLIELLERVLDRGMMVAPWVGDSRKIGRTIVIEFVITLTHENPRSVGKFGNVTSSRSVLRADEADESGTTGSDSGE